MAQIACWMTDKEADDLDRYARSLELKRAAVLALLVHRELRDPRLDGLRRRGPLYPNVKTGTRVTVRIHDPARKAEFALRATALRIGADEAAWLLFTAELAERWIEKELTWPM